MVPNVDILPVKLWTHRIAMRQCTCSAGCRHDILTLTPPPTMDDGEKILCHWLNSPVTSAANNDVLSVLRSLPVEIERGSSTQVEAGVRRFLPLVLGVTRVTGISSEMSLVASTCLVKLLCLGLGPDQARQKLLDFLEQETVSLSFEQVC